MEILGFLLGVLIFSAFLKRDEDKVIGGINHRYDFLLEKYRKNLPIEFLQALILAESTYNPNSDVGKGDPKLANAAKGLMQVVGIVRKDYNKRHNTNISSYDLFNPEINIMLGTDTLNRIFTSLVHNHPNTFNNSFWNDIRQVGLLVFGWNAGYSEAGGEGRVIRWLEENNFKNISADDVFKNASKVSGVTKYLSYSSKLAWSKRVTFNYFRILKDK